MLQHQGLDSTAIQSGLDAMRLSMAEVKSNLRVPVSAMAPHVCLLGGRSNSQAPSAQLTNSGPSWPWPNPIIDGPATDLELDQALNRHN